MLKKFKKNYKNYNIDRISKIIMNNKLIIQGEIVLMNK